jgi:hypothetical protein
VPGSQSVQVSEHNEQFSQFVQTYIKELYLPPARSPGPQVVGEFPQRAAAFEPREEEVRNRYGAVSLWIVGCGSLPMA